MLGKVKPFSSIIVPAIGRRQNYGTANSFICSKAYINGQWLESNSHQQFPVTNPATSEVIGGIADCDEQDFILASQGASQAFQQWSETTAKSRSTLLRQMADAQMANQKELAEIISLESGKPIKESMGEIAYGASFFEWFADQARSITGHILSSPSPDKTMSYARQAAGPVGIITPWNFPNAMITRKLGAALAAGCTAIIKPAPDTPYSALALAKIIDGLDIPNGVVNFLPSSVENSAKIGKFMCKSPDLKVIPFTGSSGVGKLLLSQGASTVKRVCLKSGGNASFIVFDFANLDKAVDGYIASKFRNTAQTFVYANTKRLINNSIISNNYINNFQSFKYSPYNVSMTCRHFHAAGSKANYLDFRHRFKTNHLRLHLLIIRRQKMKKHKRKKFRKKFKCLLAKQRLKREIAKEKAFRVELLTIIRRAENFDPREYALRKITEAKNKPKELSREERLEELKELIRQNRHQVTYVKPKHRRAEIN